MKENSCQTQMFRRIERHVHQCYVVHFQLHRVDLCEDVTDDSKDLPVMPHASPFTTKAYCNCGNKQAEREDPFDAKVLRKSETCQDPNLFPFQGFAISAQTGPDVLMSIWTK